MWASPNRYMDVMVNLMTVRFDRSSIVGRGIAEATAFGLDASEFRAYQHQLRRVVDPDQQNDEGRRGAIGRFEALLADVEPDEQLADLEQGRRDRGAEPDVAPSHIRVGQPFEHHGEQKRD